MNALFAATRYLSYRLKAYSAHGIHSPFVYEFITSLLRDTTPFYAFQPIRSIRSKMLLDMSILQKTDYGTGNKNGPVAVQTIAKNDLLPERYGQLLFRMVNHFRPVHILEMGTSLGITTLYLAMPNRSAHVITLEGCPETALLAQANFEKSAVENITSITGEFSTTLPDALKRLKQLDFLFLDGNHSYRPTLQYIETCLPYCHENTILVLDDIHLNAEMENAWNELCSRPEVSVSIDLFKLGLLFFRTGVPKQHFTLKF